MLQPSSSLTVILHNKSIHSELTNSKNSPGLHVNKKKNLLKIMVQHPQLAFLEVHQSLTSFTIRVCYINTKLIQVHKVVDPDPLLIAIYPLS